MKKTKSKVKRKRRSFWEPESKTLTNWLDNQSNLGVSLQLIIVDAIRKYGDGDAIESHLAQREITYDTNTREFELQPAKTIVEVDDDIETQTQEPIVVEKKIAPETTKEILDIKPNTPEIPVILPIKEEVVKEEDDYDPVAIMLREMESNKG